ncbi:unnamed protein product [Symbiodinium sp. CCMP2592]|nr:unnamed protein product [Symbiodinium sp. CCMP2592]
MGVTFLLEQPQHHTTGGLASLRIFQEMYAYMPDVARRCQLWQEQHRKAASKASAKKKVKKAIVKRNVDAAGKKTVTGIPPLVRATQEYTPEFAEAVLHSWGERCDDQQRQAELLHVVRWMKASGRLQLPSAWPADFP